MRSQLVREGNVPGNLTIPNYGVLATPQPPPLQSRNNVPNSLFPIQGDSGARSHQSAEPNPGSAQPPHKAGNNKYGLKGTHKCFRCRKYGRKVYLFLFLF